MNINTELNNFKNFLNSLSVEEFDNMLERAGIGTIKNCEDENMIYYSKIINAKQIELQSSNTYLVNNKLDNKLSTAFNYYTEEDVLDTLGDAA